MFNDISTAIPQAYLIATGNLYTGTPGDSNWLKMLNFFNLCQFVWAREKGGNWESLYNPGVAVGTVTATDTFQIPAGLLKPSNKAHDFVYVLGTSGNPTWVSGTNYSAGNQVVYQGSIYQAINNITNDTVVPPSDATNWTQIPNPIYKFKTVPGPQLKQYATGSPRRVAIVGGSQAGFAQGSELVFPRAFTAQDQEFGGQLFMPAFMAPPALVGTNGAISVDDPNWLLYYAAQEWDQTDVTLIQNVPSLVAKANDLMTSMKLDNQRMRQENQQTAPHGAAAGNTWDW